MKAQVVKLSINENEDVMLVAPQEILESFMWYLKLICFDAIDTATAKGNMAIAENYYKFKEQINDIIKEMKDTEEE